MPELHGHGFTGEEEKAIRAYVKHYVRDALRPLRIRFYMVLVGVIVGSVIGLLAYNATQDQFYKTRLSVNSTRIAANCDNIRRLAALLTVAIPQGHIKGRTVAQQRNVNHFYLRLKQLGILHADHC